MSDLENTENQIHQAASLVEGGAFDDESIEPSSDFTPDTPPLPDDQSIGLEAMQESAEPTSSSAPDEVVSVAVETHELPETGSITEDDFETEKPLTIEQMAELADRMKKGEAVAPVPDELIKQLQVTMAKMAHDLQSGQASPEIAQLSEQHKPKQSLFAKIKNKFSSAKSETKKAIENAEPYSPMFNPNIEESRKLLEGLANGDLSAIQNPLIPNKTNQIAQVLALKVGSQLKSTEKGFDLVEPSEAPESRPDAATTLLIGKTFNDFLGKQNTLKKKLESLRQHELESEKEEINFMYQQYVDSTSKMMSMRSALVSRKIDTSMLDAKINETNGLAFLGKKPDDLMGLKQVSSSIEANTSRISYEGMQVKDIASGYVMRDGEMKHIYDLGKNWNPYEFQKEGHFGKVNWSKYDPPQGMRLLHPDIPAMWEAMVANNPKIKTGIFSSRKAAEFPAHIFYVENDCDKSIKDPSAFLTAMTRYYFGTGETPAIKQCISDELQPYKPMFEIFNKNAPSEYLNKIGIKDSSEIKSKVTDEMSAGMKEIGEGREKMEIMKEIEKEDKIKAMREQRKENVRSQKQSSPTL